MFISIFCLILVTFFNKPYIKYKYGKFYNEKNNNFNIFYFCLVLSCLFILLNIIYLNIKGIYVYNLNFIVVYKLALWTFFLFFLFLLKYYFFFFKFFSFEFLWILLFSIICLNLILNSKNLMYFFVYFESYSLAILSCLALKKLSKNSLNSSFNYFIFSAILSSVILYNISIIYLFSGCLSFQDINNILNLNDNKFIFNYILIMLCILLKLSLFPLSTFLLEMYSKFSFIFIFYFLIIPKFSLINFIIFNFTSNNLILNNILYILMYLVMFTSLIHSILAIKSENFKTFIINTSFSNFPFFFLVIYLKNYFLLVSFYNFIFIYFFNLLCFFFVVFFLVCESKIAFKKFNIFLSIMSSNIYIFFIVISIFLSIAALPPFSGFFGKFFIFYLLIEYNLYFIYLVLSLINLLLIYSYLKILKNIFIKKKNFLLNVFFNGNKYLVFFSVFFFIINVLFVFYFDFLFKLASILTTFVIII